MAQQEPPKFEDLSGEYWQLFLECSVNQEKYGAVKQVATNILANRKRYVAATAALSSMPWWVLALIHAMEGMSFTRHLHNGDKLTSRTLRVPAGRPFGNPKAKINEGPSVTNPYTWEESAEDAMRMKGLHRWHDWSIRSVLFKLEEFNGWGYRRDHPDVLSPYLWSFTNKYTKGKYGADGKWDGELVSAQPGVAAILRVLIDMGVVIPIDYMGDFPDPSANEGIA